MLQFEKQNTYNIYSRLRLDLDWRRSASIKAYGNYIGCFLSIFKKAIKIKITDEQSVWVNKNSLYKFALRFEKAYVYSNTPGKNIYEALNYEYSKQKDSDFTQVIKDKIQPLLQKKITLCELHTLFPFTLRTLPQNIKLDNLQIDSLDGENTKDLLKKINEKIDDIKKSHSNDSHLWNALFLQKLKKITISDDDKSLLKTVLLKMCTLNFDNRALKAEFIDYLFTTELYDLMIDQIEICGEDIILKRPYLYFKKIYELHENSFDERIQKILLLFYLLCRKKLNNLTIKLKDEPGKCFTMNKELLCYRSPFFKEILNGYGFNHLGHQEFTGNQEQWAFLVSMIQSSNFSKFNDTQSDFKFQIIRLLFQYFGDLIKHIHFEITENLFIQAWIFAQKNAKIFGDIKAKCLFFIFQKLYRNKDFNIENLWGCDQFDYSTKIKLRTELFDIINQLKPLINYKSYNPIELKSDYGIGKETPCILIAKLNLVTIMYDVDHFVKLLKFFSVKTLKLDSYYHDNIHNYLNQILERIPDLTIEITEHERNNAHIRALQGRHPQLKVVVT